MQSKLLPYLIIFLVFSSSVFAKHWVTNKIQYREYSFTQQDGIIILRRGKQELPFLRQGPKPSIMNLELLGEQEKVFPLGFVVLFKVLTISTKTTCETAYQTKYNYLITYECGIDWPSQTHARDSGVRIYLSKPVLLLDENLIFTRGDDTFELSNDAPYRRVRIPPKGKIRVVKRKMPMKSARSVGDKTN